MGARSSPKKSIGVKDKVKKYESEIESKVAKQSIHESKSVTPIKHVKKVKMMLNLFEVSHTKMVVHAPKTESEASKIECDISIDKKEDMFRVANALDVLMASGGGKTPMKKVKRLKSTKK